MRKKHYLEEEFYQKIQKDKLIFDFLETNSLDGIWYWDMENPENKWLSLKAAEALGIECIVLNAEALAGQDADVLGEGGTPLFAALLTAADKLGMQYVATAHRARVETGADGVHTVCPPAGTGSDDSTILAALPQETLARLILPLGDFAPEDVAEMAEDFKV